MAIQDLIQVLQEQTETHDQLLQLALEKKNVLIQNQVEQLNQLVHKESKLVKRISELEEKRLFETDRFIVGKGYRPDPKITISEVIKLVFKAEEKQALQKAHDELLSVISRLKEVNDINQQLIEQSLKFIDFMLDVISGAPEEEAVYRHPSQQPQSSSRRGLFDTRA